MSNHAKTRIAVAQYAIEPLSSWDAYRAKIGLWVADAANAGAELLLFPEYGGMELVSLFERRATLDRRGLSRHESGPHPPRRADRRVETSLAREAYLIQSVLNRFCALHADLAERHRVYIVAGSVPVRHADGGLRNTAYFFTPDGIGGYQEKLVLTRWEREVWGIVGGDEIKVFDTRFGRVGINICYDAEFPLVARRQAEAGAQLILVPCCTASLRGFHRVRVGARARALENLVYVAQSPIVGDSPWLGSIGSNVGSAAVYAPPDLGPREDGLLIEGPLNDPIWLYANLDLGAVERMRHEGRLPNQREWTDHMILGPAVESSYRHATTLIPAANAAGRILRTSGVPYSTRKAVASKACPEARAGQNNCDSTPVFKQRAGSNRRNTHRARGLPSIA